MHYCADCRQHIPGVCEVATLRDAARDALIDVTLDNAILSTDINVSFYATDEAMFYRLHNRTSWITLPDEKSAR